LTVPARARNHNVSNGSAKQNGMGSFDMNAPNRSVRRFHLHVDKTEKSQPRDGQTSRYQSGRFDNGFQHSICSHQ
jgi:hypothetical protein